MGGSEKAQPQVGLFVTCLVDLIRPSVGFAAVKLLEDAGCRVAVPAAQTCCGQPAYNSGDKTDAKAIARQTIDAFEGYDYVVAPSGSCAGMLSKHYPELFEGDEEMSGRARDLARRTFELVSFLTDVRGVTSVDAAFSGPVTYHDSCSRVCGRCACTTNRANCSTRLTMLKSVSLTSTKRVVVSAERFASNILISPTRWLAINAPISWRQGQTRC